MKVLKIIGIVILSIIALVILLSAFLPSTATVQRSAEINAPSDSIYAYLSDFNNFADWSPWARIEPDKIKYKVEGSGIGSSYSWTGEQTGKGKMTITDLKPGSNVKVHMAFIQPWPSEADVEWIIEPAGADKSKVTWAFAQPLKFSQRIFPGLVMDKFLGASFEQGLSFLKIELEKK